MILSSLSSVRDRLLGSVELFRVSPIGPTSILGGKSLGFLFLLGLIAVVLSLAGRLALNVPMLGDQLYY